MKSGWMIVAGAALATALALSACGNKTVTLPVMDIPQGQTGQKTEIGYKLGEGALRVGTDGVANDWSLGFPVTDTPYFEYHWPAAQAATYRVQEESAAAMGCPGAARFAYSWIELGEGDRPLKETPLASVTETFATAAGKNYLLRVKLVNFQDCLGAQLSFRILEEKKTGIIVPSPAPTVPSPAPFPSPSPLPNAQFLGTKSLKVNSGTNQLSTSTQPAQDTIYQDFTLDASMAVASAKYAITAAMGSDSCPAAPTKTFEWIRLGTEGAELGKTEITSGVIFIAEAGQRYILRLKFSAVKDCYFISHGFNVSRY